jgi:hypothetical protein
VHTEAGGRGIEKSNKPLTLLVKILKIKSNYARLYSYFTYRDTVFKTDLWIKSLKSRTLWFILKRSVTPLQGEADLESSTEIGNKILP